MLIYEDNEEMLIYEDNEDYEDYEDYLNHILNVRVIYEDQLETQKIRYSQ